MTDKLQYRVFNRVPVDSETEPDNVFYLTHDSTPVHPAIAKQVRFAKRVEVYVMEDGTTPLALRYYQKNKNGVWEETWCWDNGE